MRLTSYDASYETCFILNCLIVNLTVVFNIYLLYVCMYVWMYVCVYLYTGSVYCYCFYLLL